MQDLVLPGLLLASTMGAQDTCRKIANEATNALDKPGGLVRLKEFLVLGYCSLAARMETWYKARWFSDLHELLDPAEQNWIIKKRHGETMLSGISELTAGVALDYMILTLLQWIAYCHRA